MKSLVVAAAVLAASATSAFAQADVRTPMEIARAQEACGNDQNDRIISARYLEDGRIGVRCAREGAIIGAGAGAAAAGAGFGGTTAAVVFTTLVLGAAAAGGSSSTSDTQ